MDDHLDKEAVLRRSHFRYTKAKSKVRIALIPTTIKSKWLETFPAGAIGEYKLSKLKDRNKEEYVSKYYLEAIASILELERVDIICFPELSFPTNCTSLYPELTRISITEKVYIVAGSFHDMADYYHKCFVFTPHSNEPFIFKKHDNAENDSEYFRTPSRELIGLNTEFGMMTILICLDLSNPDFCAKMEYLRNRPSSVGIDLIISPTRNREIELSRQWARTASILGGCYVALVNDGFLGKPGAWLYYRGDEILLDKLNSKIPIHFKEIDLQKMKPVITDYKFSIKKDV